MKHLLLSLIALSLVVACGKDNKSGKKDSWTYTDTYLGNVSTPTSLQAVFDAVPCLGGTGRAGMEFLLTGFQTVVPAGDIYVGITSYGDIAVIQGNGTSAPRFVAYLCSRDFTNPQGSVLSNVRLGSYSNCQFKPITSASLVFPGSVGSAEFRMLDFGVNNGSGQLVKATSICR